MGSNVVEFILLTSKDHGIETLFLKPAHEMELKPFSLWYNYETKSSHKHRRCSEPGAEEKDLLQQTSGFGVHMILEVEDMAGPMKPASLIQANRRQV